MGSYIQYQNTFCKSLKLTISPESPFQKILATLNSIHFAGCILTNEQINYAVLELLNNSLRAHRDRGVGDEILLRFSMEHEGLHVYLRDRGGGFDVNTLPYSLEEDPARINVHDTSFELYRQRYNYARFGLGLYLAKKTFPVFSLSFVDQEGRETSWEEGNTDGTVIVLSTASGPAEGGDGGGRKRTALESRSTYV